MLQQTQVGTVIPYYQKFIESFPSVQALAAATEEQVLAHWSGLGYYARGRNLHRAAQLLMAQYGGEFPREFEKILALPGVGRSTAAAICALAFHQRHAILDGNVKRLLARHDGIEGWTSDKKIEAQLWQQAEWRLPNAEVAIYTQALMDMGATICTRSRPKCAHCPLQNSCVALASGRVKELPTPRPRKLIPQRHTVMLLLISDHKIWLEKRPPIGIWGGLWSLPQFDDEPTALRQYAQWMTEAAPENNLNKIVTTNRQGGIEGLPEFVHVFTHFKLHIRPLLIQLDRQP